MRKMGKSQNCRNERTLSGRVLLRRSESEYPSAGRVADGEKVDVSTLGKEIGCHDTVATEMTKAPLAECITSDMYKWHKLFMVLQDGCLSCYRTIVESVLEVEQVSVSESESWEMVACASCISC